MDGAALRVRGVLLARGDERYLGVGLESFSVC
jgi:hypothetical protein